MYFYPRSPRGERQLPRNGSRDAYRFLSTLPARGATEHESAQSVHLSHFYPRSPRGERLNTNPLNPFIYHISIHAPREGSDQPAFPGLRENMISIHAPREGSDTASHTVQFVDSDFYPRSPRGERPLRGAKVAPPLDFYPRSPRGERRYRPEELHPHR